VFSTDPLSYPCLLPLQAAQTPLSYPQHRPPFFLATYELESDLCALSSAALPWLSDGTLWLLTLLRFSHLSASRTRVWSLTVCVVAPATGAVLHPDGVVGEFCFDVLVWPIKRWTAPASAGCFLPSTNRAPGTFAFLLLPFSFTFPRLLVVLFPPKFWVGFSGFSFGKILGNLLFDSGQGSIAGLAWKLPT